MAFNKSIFIIYFLFATCQISHALTPIEPPVKSPGILKKSTHTTFNFINRTSLESDLRWRNLSLQNQQPGMANYSHASMNYFHLKSSVDFNLFTNSSSTSREDSSVTLNHLMAETKIGAQYPIGTLWCNPVTWGVSRTITMWPGAKNYEWNTNKESISELSKIKPIKSTELSMHWNDYSLFYAITDQNTKTEANSVTQEKNWGNYFEIKTPRITLQKLYTVGFKLTYWENINKGIEANFSYRFRERIHGLLNLYTMRSYQDSEDDTGINAGVQFVYKTQTKPRRAT